MSSSDCRVWHPSRRIVLTGGPGGGKTAVLELMRKTLCRHVIVLPEAAGVVFGGGFPRDAGVEARRAAQRAIFYVQRELEAAVEGADAAIVLCDRGTIDGLAYWPGPEPLWASVGTSLEDQLGRYHAVIHLRTPGADAGYDHSNPLRVESATDAAAIDRRIAAAWERHPRCFEVAPTTDFLAKAARAIELIRGELPECCRQHPVAALGEPGGGAPCDIDSAHELGA